ncbi:hypothetical protein ABMA27_000332 [Loxostege sticticalis]|uniref:Uncharacterized protein n=1 Tax=Loxostege sticticalis TaxID=481309 RepID=A0ABR3IN26_LOXSC
MVSCSVMDCSTTKRHNPGKFSFHSKYFDEKYLQSRGAKRILLITAIPTNFVPTISSYH